MASYGLVASETTVQVLSPTLVLPIEYVTIQTQPSGVIASLGVSRATFNAGGSGILLQDYANNIELLMTFPHVIAAQGSQSLDTNGLIADNVVFTVEYVPAGANVTSVTAEAVVPSGWLSEGGDPAIERVLIAKAEAIITGVYDNLAAAAGA
jgi:hypothetical protein